MGDIVKGVGVHPPTTPTWADFTLMMYVRKWALPLCGLIKRGEKFCKTHALNLLQKVIYYLMLVRNFGSLYCIICKSDAA
jgi:hypothetical protein